MLVLTRKHQEQICIGNDVTITILKVKGKSVRIGIDAPKDIRVVRGELPEQSEAKQSKESVTSKIKTTLASQLDQSEKISTVVDTEIEPESSSISGPEASSDYKVVSFKVPVEGESNNRLEASVNRIKTMQDFMAKK